jgi:glycopeptide antibiotics resistance protein
LPNLEGAYRHLLPWFLPGFVVSVLLAFLVAPGLARILRTGRPLAWAAFVTFGIIISATLTPLRGTLNFAAVGGTCDFSRVGLAPIGALLHVDDTSLNVLLFIPFGVAIGLVERIRPRAGLVVIAIALPFVIETTQLLVPALERGCQSADVFDNLTGLVIGLLVGVIARWIVTGDEPAPS